MLEPREADIPVLFLVLVVLPLVAYILLGKCNESAKKNARISMLAKLAAEEAIHVESMTSADIIQTLPSPMIVFYECAKCSAPATTRCSRCKTVRYCSGKCQIIHWRQGHRQECHRWQGNHMNLSDGLVSVSDTIQIRSLSDNSNPFLENDFEEPMHSDFLFDAPNESNDSAVITTNTSKISTYERKLSHSDERMFDKSRRESSKGDEGVACAFDKTSLYAADTEASARDGALEHKFGSANLKPSDEIQGSQDRSRQTCAYAPKVRRDVMRQSQNLTDEATNVFKRSNSPCVPTSLPLDRNDVMNGTETGSEFSEECQFSYDGSTSGRGILYKKPPYILRPTIASQKLLDEASKKFQWEGTGSNENAKDECRASELKVSSSNHKGTLDSERMKMPGSRKNSKVTKRSLFGLLKDYKKNKVLFPYEDIVKFFQCEVGGISPRGLLNCGNSCYANAVLQCLSCTKPLILYLLQRSHSRTCWVRDWCLMCELEQHVSMLREVGGPLSPSRILSNINIGCRMGGGNQEDAHEFLRLLIMSMQSICLEGMGGEKEVDPCLQETTLIQQIFGGRLKSKVKCMRCHLESERYENIMDLTLEIHGWVESLEDALTQFTAPEDLDGENMYRCGRCSKYVKARKQLSVHEVPNILTIVLKRFQTGEYGKINKRVTFPDMLDMIPFVTGTADIPPLYMLYAAVVHLDTLNASFSGHYVSYIKDIHGTWFRIDDSEVQVVPLSQVMSEGAYMLFYSRSFPRPPRAYTEKSQSRPPPPSTQAVYKSPKSSWHVQDPKSGSTHARGPTGRCEESFADAVSMDFSDATSSDWSLFTSSDESSFTTESTRNSFSTVDQGEVGSLDAISSIFNSFYATAEYPQSNTVSCTKFSRCGPETRFHLERKGFALDSSAPERTVGDLGTGRHRTEQIDRQINPSLYGGWWSDAEQSD